nr:MAG TPA: NADH dehydrogenase 1 beta subcomplex subunit 2 [Caudoviricetes sp.]
MITNEKGFTLTLPAKDGTERVMKRCKTSTEYTDYLQEIYSCNSSWTDEELARLIVHNDFFYTAS